MAMVGWRWGGARSGARLALVVAGVMAFGAACTPAAPALTVPPQPIVDCLAVPSERCAAALDQAVAEAPAGGAPIRVRMTCSQPACTVGGGRAQVDAWFSDGSVSSWPITWTGALELPPDGAPADGAILPVTPACIGVDIARCREMAKGIIVPVGQTGRVVAIVVTCTVAECGPTEGQGTTRVTFEDGTTREADWAYAGG